MRLFPIRLIIAAFGLWLIAGSAHAASLNGTWIGNGFIDPRGAERQRVRCVVTYSRQTPRVFGVRATCASSSGSLRQTGEVLKIRPNLFAGDFYNRQFDIGGRIRVTISGGRQTVTLRSSDGNGRLSLRRR